MKRLVSTTAIVVGALWFGTMPGHAVPTVSDTSYTVTDALATGPSIAGKLSINNLALPTTLGVETTPVNFFTLTPVNGPLTNDGTTFFNTCPTGVGCSGNTEQTTVSINLGTITVNGLTGGTRTANAGIISGAFTAQYDPKKPAIGCSIGDGGPNPGQSDCFVWAGAPSTFNGSVEDAFLLGSGFQLDVFLYNASDWSITPTVGFEVQALAVPAAEPASLALLGVGLLGLGCVASRKRRLPG